MELVDTLVVDPKTRGIRHIFVYIRKVDKAKIHPKLKSSTTKVTCERSMPALFSPATFAR